MEGSDFQIKIRLIQKKRKFELLFFFFSSGVFCFFDLIFLKLISLVKIVVNGCGCFSFKLDSAFLKWPFFGLILY